MTMEVGDLLEHLKNRLKSKSEAGDAQAAIARREQDRYAQRVIVQQGDDAVTARAAKNLADKHPDNTVLVKADQQGNLIGLEQVPAGRGNVKVQVVGHGDVESGKLGGADAPTVARQIEQVKARLGEEAQVGKVALVGCQTACETDAGQPSLTERVQNELAKQGTGVGELTGRATYVKVDADGRKRDTTAEDRGALPSDAEKLGPKRPSLVESGATGAKEGGDAETVAKEIMKEFGPSAEPYLYQAPAHSPLDSAEIMSIGLYSDFAYHGLNSSLRNEGLLGNGLNLIDASLQTAIPKLRNDSRDPIKTYRGVLNIIDPHVEGARFSDKGYMSTSKHAGDAFKPSRGIKKDATYRKMIVFGYSGGDISNYVGVFNEGEVLYPKGVIFKNILKSNDGHQVVLEEVGGKNNAGEKYLMDLHSSTRPDGYIDRRMGAIQPNNSPASSPEQVRRRR
ncbi:hypothetical protein WJ82_18600 [Burkholderia ubonensis]|nr:hypothetical protein WJ82_18600 [Burkholderia ubonensis]